MMMLLFDTIIITAVLLSLLIASFTDLKTREIPDWISYGLIFFVLCTRLLQSLLTKEYTYFTSSLLTFAVFFGFGSLLYYTRQWGGGDAKLLAGLGAAFATSPFYITASQIIPFPGILVLNILIIGAIYAIIFATYLALKHKKSFIIEFKKLNKEPKMRTTKSIILIIAIAFALISYFYFPENLKVVGGSFALILLIMPYLLVFIKSVELACMYKTVTPEKLTEGDWVQEDVYKGKKLIYKTKPYGIDMKSIELLKKEKIKHVLIKEGIPFIPSFLLGTIATLILGKVIFFPVL